MQFIWFFIILVALIHQNVLGLDLSELLGDIQPRFEAAPSINSTAEDHLNSSLDGNSTDVQNRSIASEAITDSTSTDEVDQANSTLDARQPTRSDLQSTDQTASSRTAVATTSDRNESHPSTSRPPGEESSSNATGIASSSTEVDGGGGGEESEGVARGKPTTAETPMNATTPKPETVFEKARHLINDTYVLSILLPVAAGVVFATAILLTIAMCRCLRRGCRRRRLRRKILPDSVKNLRPSDRARLLAESSDEEF